MAKLRPCMLLTLVRPPSPRGSSLEKFRLPAMIFVVILFCAVAAIPSPAQSVSFTSLYSFCWINHFCPGGYGPYSGLVQAADGSLYGTTSGGGSGCPPHACGGAIFKITPE